MMVSFEIVDSEMEEVGISNGFDIFLITRIHIL